MCASKPKVPKVQDIPMRATALLPDNGDPAVRLGLRAKRSLSMSSAILANRAGTLALPSVTGPIATTGM